MAVTAETQSNRVSLKLNMGTSDTGTIVTATQSISGLKKSAWTSADNTAVYAIINALMPLMGYSLYKVVHTEAKYLEEE